MEKSNMAEYVNREEILAEYDRQHQGPAGGARKIMAEWPAADVAPVHHGKWIPAKTRFASLGGDPVWQCSECGKGIHTYGIEHALYNANIADGQWKYCPNCGAKMDGER